MILVETGRTEGLKKCVSKCGWRLKQAVYTRDQILCKLDKHKIMPRCVLQLTFKGKTELFHLVGHLNSLCRRRSFNIYRKAASTSSPPVWWLNYVIAVLVDVLFCVEIYLSPWVWVKRMDCIRIVLNGFAFS